MPLILTLEFTVPLILSIADREPDAPGVNVSIMVQEPLLCAIVPPLAHVPDVRAKSVALVPVIVKNGVLSISSDEPVFVTVTVSPLLVVLTG